MATIAHMSGPRGPSVARCGPEQMAIGICCGSGTLWPRTSRKPTAPRLSRSTRYKLCANVEPSQLFRPAWFHADARGLMYTHPAPRDLQPCERIVRDQPRPVKIQEI